MLGFEMLILGRGLEWGFWCGGVGCGRGVAGKMGWREDGLEGRGVGGKMGWREDGLKGRWVGGKMGWREDAGCREDGLERRRVGGKTGLGGWFGDGAGKKLGRDWFLRFWVGVGSGLGGEEMELGVFGCVIGEGGGCWSCDYEGEHQGVATGSDVWVGCGMGDFSWTMKNRGKRLKPANSI